MACNKCMYYQRESAGCGYCTHLPNIPKIRSAHDKECVRFIEKDPLTQYAEQCEDEEENNGTFNN